MGNDASKNSAELLEKEIEALKYTTELSEQEIRELYDDFKSDCPSGKMNKNQFVKFFKEAVSGLDDKAGSFADSAFAAFDRNQDGTIDFSEFVLAVAFEACNDIDTQLDVFFRMIDTSGDEQISYNELVAFINIVVKLQDDEELQNMNSKVLASSIYSTFGVGTSKKLSKEQFMNGCKNDEALKKMF